MFLEASFTAPWCTTAHISPGDIRAFIERPGQIIAYHFVIDGRLQCAAGEPPMEVAASEVVLLPRNEPHTLSSAPGIAPVEAGTLIQPGKTNGLWQIDHGGGGEPTRLVCGFLATDEAHNPLIATLPRLLKLNIRNGASRDWVEASARFAARELAAGKYASSTVVSRSAFNDRFTALVGMPPIRYLRHWRLQMAKEKLRGGRQNIAQIARAAGYESEVAFKRAFKLEFGEPPARWREFQGNSK